MPLCGVDRPQRGARRALVTNSIVGYISNSSDIGSDRMRIEDLQGACLELLQAARDWRRLADAVVSPHGLSEATALPLIHIAGEPGRSQHELARKLGIEAASLVRGLDQLCVAGLVTRVADEADRRVKRLVLTPAGDAVARRLKAELDALRLSVFADLDPADIAASRRLFARIAAREGDAAAGVPHERAGA